MRAVLGVVVGGVLLLGACSSSSDAPVRIATDEQTAPSSPTAPSGPGSPGTPGGGGSGSNAGQDAVCVEVRAGIDAFNAADYDATVRHFRKAVPLAEDAVAAHDSTSAEKLLEAVRYYADLAPGDYLAASVGSADFATYKAITLGQCESGGSPDGGGTGGGGVSI